MDRNQKEYYLIHMEQIWLVKTGHLNVVKFLTGRIMNIQIIIDGYQRQYYLKNLILNNNRINALKFLAEKNLLPNIYGQQIWLQKMVILRSGERSCASDIVKWFNRKGILPNVNGPTDFSCKNGHLNVLKWLNSKGILPNDNNANKVYSIKRSYKCS